MQCFDEQVKLFLCNIMLRQSNIAKSREGVCINSLLRVLNPTDLLFEQ